MVQEENRFWHFCLYRESRSIYAIVTTIEWLKLKELNIQHNQEDIFNIYKYNLFKIMSSKNKIAIQHLKDINQMKKICFFIIFIKKIFRNWEALAIYCW